MLHWFIRFPEFIKFTELLFHVGKTLVSFPDCGMNGHSWSLTTYINIETILWTINKEHVSYQIGAFHSGEISVSSMLGYTRFKLHTKQRMNKDELHWSDRTHRDHPYKLITKPFNQSSPRNDPIYLNISFFFSACFELLPPATKLGQGYMHNKSGVKDPSINTCQDSSVGKAWDCKEEVNNTILGSRVKSLLEGTFLLNLFCSNTVLASMPEWSISGKTQLSSTSTWCEFLLLLFSTFVWMIIVTSSVDIIKLRYFGFCHDKSVCETVYNIIS